MPTINSNLKSGAGGHEGVGLFPTSFALFILLMVLRNV